MSRPIEGTMSPASKRKWWSALLFAGLPGLLTVITLDALRSMLGIHSQLWDFTGGWQPQIAWLFIFCLVFGFFQRRFNPRHESRRRQPEQEPDSYTFAQTELAIERAAKTWRA